jgi:hypothetical protein
MLNGMVWYHPKVFFDRWWKIIGKEGQEPQTDGMALMWILTILSAGVKAIAVGVVVGLATPILGPVTALSGLLTGVLAWAGFIAPTFLTNKLFAGHGFAGWAIEAGNHLVDMAVFGLFFGLLA